MHIDPETALGLLGLAGLVVASHFRLSSKVDVLAARMDAVCERTNDVREEARKDVAEIKERGACAFPHCAYGYHRRNGAAARLADPEEGAPS